MTPNTPDKPRALVVDDDSAMVEYVSRVLQSAGFEVESCGDGMTALSMFRASHFDAVVLDERMPRLSGVSFLKNLRLAPGNGCRIVMLSSMDDQKIQRAAVEAGATACLVKPASPKAIIAAVTGAAPEDNGAGK